MSRPVVAVCVLTALTAACGDDTRPDYPPFPHEPDAPPSAPWTVRLTSPNGGETLYPAEPFVIAWTPTDASGVAITYDVAVIDEATEAETAVATGVTATEVTWTPSGVAAPTAYRARVTATDDRGRAVSDDSDASFTVAPPLTGTSFARDVQPIFTANCLPQFCHGTQTQTAQLHLAPGAAYGSLVGRHSVENPCTSYLRVSPGLPDESYLAFKIAGSGSCFFGVRMPKGSPALAAIDIATIRAWISEGALDN